MVRKRNGHRGPFCRLFFNKKGVVAYYLTFIIIAVVIITITAILAPMGVMFNTRMYEMGEQILIDNNVTIAAIADVNVRESIYNITGAALAATETNIEVNADLFRYGWALVICLSGFIIFLFTRRSVEYAGAGGFI